MKNIFVLFLFFPLLGFAIDAVNPESTCDRFMTKAENKKCLEKIKKLQPDSYLASVCEKQFDDDAFYDCIEISGFATFNPIKVSHCEDTSLSDNARLDCVRGVADYSKKNESQERIPASLKSKKRKLKK